MNSEDAILTSSRGAFFRGLSWYLDSYPGLVETQPRIYVKFRPEGTDSSFLALLDTGGHFCIFNQTVADLVKDQLTEGFGPVTLRTARGPVYGQLYSYKITLIAELGESLDVEATVLVPPDWQAPCFIGYSGALDRMRFAIDPQENRFHFGSLY